MKQVSLHTQAYAPKRYTAGFGMVAITRTQSIHIVKYENLDNQLERIELVGGGGGEGGGVEDPNTTKSEPPWTRKRIAI